MDGESGKNLTEGLTEWLETGDHFDHQGHGIFFRRSGAGAEVLLCLHGFPTSSYDYRKIWGTLAERFSLLAFDMIGYGFSAKPTDFDYTTFAQADVLEALLRYLNVRSVHILSHDYGNTIVQELLARAEEGGLDFKIKTICFLNGALFPETHRPILAQKLLLSPIGSLFGRLVTDGIYKKSLASVFGSSTRPGDDELDEFAALFNFNNGKRVANRLIRYMKERERYRERWVAPLQRMTQPFMFINGIDDPVSGIHLVERFREVVPDQTNIVELPGIGHFPHFEAPNIVIGRYFDFREQNDG